MTTYNYIIADDDLAFSLVIKNQLDKLPFLDHLGSYDNLELLLNKIGEQTPDLLFLDYNMNTNDGLSFLAELEHKPTTIMISSDDDLFLQDFPDYIKGFIWKPNLKLEELELTIKKSLGI